MKITRKIGDGMPFPLCIPKDLVDQGFVGEIDMIVNATTATIIKPGTSLEEIKKSLKLTIMEIDLQINEKNKQEKAKVEGEPSTESNQQTNNTTTNKK